MAASFLRSCLITRDNSQSSNQSDLCPLVVPVDCGYLRKRTLLIDRYRLNFLNVTCQCHKSKHYH